MPLYEYQCDACGHRFETIQKFSDPKIDTCPVCGGPVHKLLSSPAIQFKGSGFYINDYARKPSPGGPSTKDTSKSDSSKSDTSGSGSSGSSDTSNKSDTSTKKD